MSICGSWAVLEDNAFNAVLTPHNIEQPIKQPFLSITEAVVAVPKSNIICGQEYLSMLATAPATISAPSSAGLFVFILSPVLTPGPITMDFLPVISIIAFDTVRISGGTTDEITLPSILSGFILHISSMLCSFIAYSSAESLSEVERRHSFISSFPSRKPRTIFVLPMSTAKIIFIFPFCRVL